MAFAFQAMLMLVSLAGTAMGSAGVYGSAAVLGLTDVDALTVSMARGVAHAVSLDTAAVAVAVGVLANTGLKLTFASLFGSPRFQRIVGLTLGLMVLLAVASLARRS